MLRNEVAAELTEKLGRRELSEAGTREAQAALEVEAEGRRAGQAQMASREMKNLTLVVGRMEGEGNYLFLILVQGAVGGHPFFRQKGQLGFFSPRARRFTKDTG